MFSRAAGDVDTYSVIDCSCHLGSHESLPDQPVEAMLIARQISLDSFRLAKYRSGSDCLVSFLSVYKEAKDEDAAPEEKLVKIPSSVEEAQPQELLQLIPEQHFTQPLPRYSEASLVRTLEENGIG